MSDHRHYSTDQMSERTRGYEDTIQTWYRAAQKAEARVAELEKELTKYRIAEFVVEARRVLRRIRSWAPIMTDRVSTSQRWDD